MIVFFGWKKISHLFLGGIDFSVFLWDIYTGTLLHRLDSRINLAKIGLLLIQNKKKKLQFLKMSMCVLDEAN